MKPTSRSPADACNAPLDAGRRDRSSILHAAAPFLVFRFPLAPDEAYYWQWSRHLDLGYYDQGPMIAWWIRAGTVVFGHTALGVRAGIVVAARAYATFVFLTARDLFGPRMAALP